MTQKHILVVSQYFYPEQFRINDMCSEWVKRGYKITVLTGIPNYPQGKFFNGYSLFKKRRENWNGIEIIRIPIISRGNNVIRLALNYLSFLISGWFWKCFTKIKADRVFIFEVSPMTQALVGVWYSNRRKIPCDIYVQDLWPENVEIITGIHNKTFLGIIGKMVNYIYKNCHAIFATSPSFVEKIKDRVFDNKDKVKYLPQYAEDFYKPSSLKSGLVPKDDRFKVVFTGNIGQAQGLEILPSTAKLLKEQGKSVLFVIVGDGRYKEQFLNDIALNKVEDMFLLLGHQPPENIPPILSSCDVAFVSFMNNELFANTIPAKLQSYMACGMPIVAAAQGETARIITEAECGMCCKIGDGEALAKTVSRMMVCSNLLQMSENALTYSRERFDKEKILSFIDDCCHSNVSVEGGFL